MMNEFQVSDDALKAFENAFHTGEAIGYEAQIKKALAAVAPHIAPLGYEVKRLEWEKQEGACLWIAFTPFGAYQAWGAGEYGGWMFDSPFGDDDCIPSTKTQSGQEAKAAAQADFERRVRECHAPRPDVKTLIDEIRNGTRQGFLNEGDQPESSDEELSCPYCNGSGHVDDVVTKPVDVAVLVALHKAKHALECLEDAGYLSGIYEPTAELAHAAIAAIRALSAEPAQGDYFSHLISKARKAAEKASVEFPQPNYVLTKVAEEAGEVVRGGVHYAEKRMEWADVEKEIVQLMAMIIRLITEGDQVIGITPPPFKAQGD